MTPGRKKERQPYDIQYMMPGCWKSVEKLLRSGKFGA
jgi:hypothetical protein